VANSRLRIEWRGVNYSILCYVRVLNGYIRLVRSDDDYAVARTVMSAAKMCQWQDTKSMYKQKHGESMATAHGDLQIKISIKLELTWILPRYVKANSSSGRYISGLTRWTLGAFR